MNTEFTAQITVYADIETVWRSLTQADFIKEYFPEIKKNLSGMGKYIQSTHPNPKLTSATYLIPRRAIGFTSGAGIDITLPRKDLQANIESIDIQLKEKGGTTKIKMAVVYTAGLGRSFFLVHRCIRGLMNIKLAVLKQDIESDYKLLSWTNALA